MIGKDVLFDRYLFFWWWLCIKRCTNFIFFIYFLILWIQYSIHMICYLNGSLISFCWMIWKREKRKVWARETWESFIVWLNFWVRYFIYFYKFLFQTFFFPLLFFFFTVCIEPQTDIINLLLVSCRSTYEIYKGIVFDDHPCWWQSLNFARTLQYRPCIIKYST